MSVTEGVADVVEDVQQADQGEGSRLAPSGANATGLDLGLKDVGQAPALDHLHREEAAAIHVDAELMNGHDVGVLQLAGDLCFFEEADSLAIVGLVEEELDGDLAVNVRINGAEDGAH